MPIPQGYQFNPLVEEFQTYVSQHLRQGSLGALPEQPGAPPRYFPDSDREEFFRNSEQVRRLLNAVLEPQHRHLVRLDVLQQNYTKVFSILVCISRGPAIVHFVNKPGFTDEHLPFLNRGSFPSRLSDETFFDDFSKKQWMFCAPKLDFHEWWLWEPERILPIVYEKELGRGASARTFLLRVHPAHNNLHREPRKDGDDLYDVFVVKAFRPRDFDQSENETQLFVRTQHSLHKTMKDARDDCIVRFYGSYRHGNTFHIILEYANEGTLEDFFQNVAPPTNPHDMYVFWRNILQLLCALTTLHNVGEEDSEGYFCHYDIKPHNVLVSSRMKKSAYDYRFILSDFGECRFRIKIGSELKGRAAPGTHTYGAPELYDPDVRATLTILRAGPEVDIWSLGGVLSEAATWVAKGKDGLARYREMRTSCQRYYGPGDSDCFHNGVDVLPSVTEHHKYIADAVRMDDSITGEVLKLVGHMLTGPQNRREWDARTLRVLAKDALERSKGMLVNPEGALSTPSVSGTKGKAPVGTRSSAQTDAVLQRNTSLHASSLQDPAPETLRRETSSHQRRAFPTQGNQNPVVAPQWTLSGIQQLRQRHKPLPGPPADLENRQYLFLLDNSTSMSAHWVNVLKLLEPMAYMTKRHGRHGINLSFTCRGPSRRFRNITRLMDEAKKYSPTTPTPDRPLQTYIEASLGSELENYRQRLEKVSKRRWTLTRNVKRMVIYVFTDGRWQQNSSVTAHIKRLVATLDEYRKSSNQFGIQFVQFGDNAPAQKLLECRLDLSRNIVDIEPFLDDENKDNLRKIFLGSINRHLYHTNDDQRNSIPIARASPTAEQRTPPPTT